MAANGIPTWTTIKNDIVARRNNRKALRDLEEAFAAFRTTREIDDLMASFDNLDGEDVENIRTVLAVKRARAYA